MSFDGRRTKINMTLDLVAASLRPLITELVDSSAVTSVWVRKVQLSRPVLREACRVEHSDSGRSRLVSITHEAKNQRMIFQVRYSDLVGLEMVVVSIEEQIMPALRKLLPRHWWLDLSGLTSCWEAREPAGDLVDQPVDLLVRAARLASVETNDLDLSRALLQLPQERCDPILAGLGLNAISNRNVVNSLFRTYPLDRLAADERSFVSDDLTLERFLTERSHRTAWDCERWITGLFKALGHTGPAAIRRARAFERALVKAGLIDEYGQLQLGRLTAPLVEEWVEIHNWYVMKIGLASRLAFLPGEINPFTQLRDLVVPGLDDRLRQLPYRTLYAWIVLGLMIRDMELGKGDHSLADLAAIDQRAMDAGLSVYGAVALAVCSPSYELAVSSLYKLITVRGIGSHYRSKSVAQAIVKAASYRFSIDYRQGGLTHCDLSARSTQLILKNEELWNRALSKAGVLPQETG